MTTDILQPPLSQHQAPTQPGLIIGLSAASAAGKTYVGRRLTEAGAVRPQPTLATRPPRPHETSNSYDHIFVRSDEFKAYRQAGTFAVTASLYGFEYGLQWPRPTADAAKPTLVLIKPCVTEQFRAVFPDSKVYFLESEDGKERAVELMYARGQASDDILKRMADYDAEVELGRETADRHFKSPGHPGISFDAIHAAIQQEVGAR